MIQELVTLYYRPKYLEIQHNVVPPLLMSYQPFMVVYSFSWLAKANTHHCDLNIVCPSQLVS